MSSGKYVKWDEPKVEHGAGPEEDALIHEIEQQINTCQNAVWAESRHAYSGTHVKSHAFLKGEFEILSGLPTELAQGMFAKPGKHNAAMRFSTETTAMIDDRIRQPRGIGLKIFEVEGEKLRNDGVDPKTQDFEFNSCPVLELANARTCRDIIALRLKHGGCPADLDGALKKRDDYEVQDGRNHIPAVNLLGQRQYGQAAFRWGDYVAKYALIPSPSQVSDKELSDSDSGHAFSEQLRNHFAKNGAEWDFQVQLLERSFFEKEPECVEDARINWPQKEYPFVTVAKLRIPAQESMMPARRVFWEDRLRLNPWDGLRVHLPLGSINRVRKGVYRASAVHRRKLNATFAVDCTSIDDIPDEKPIDKELKKAGVPIMA